MDKSRYIAGLMGPLLLLIGLSILLNPSLYPAMVTQIAQNFGLIFLAGIVSFVAGLAIVRAHNIWDASWRVLVTVLGWLAVAGGAVRILFPDRAAAIAQGFMSGNLITFAAVVPLALGAFLTYKGYAQQP